MTSGQTYTLSYGSAVSGNIVRIWIAEDFKEFDYFDGFWGGSLDEHCLPSLTSAMNHPNRLCSTTCGDSIKSLTEECDDGNTFSGDGCDS